MSKSNYEIPLTSMERESEGKNGLYVLIDDRRVSIVDYSGSTPYDLISMWRHEAIELVRILMTWLAAESTVHGAFDAEYGEFKND